ncbi:MAG: response regulator transcription factor, partial [Planctomycetota bacterium]
MPKVLLAEDDPFLRKAFTKALQRLADTVIDVENGLEAKQYLEEHPDIDLIISDWMMPQMTGPELLSFAKGETAYRHIPFVIITARESVNDAIACLEQGADEYLRKPCHINELLARARNMLRVKEYQDELKRLATTDGLTRLFNHS